MASQKQKKSLSKSKTDIMSSTLNKGEPIRRKHKAIVVILCAMVITIATTSVVKMVKIQQANQNKLEQLIKSNTKDQQLQLKKQNEDTQNQQQKLQEQIEELKKQVKAKKESKIAEAVKPVQVAQAAPAPTDSNEAKMFIYMKESGNRTNAINASSGACGLGQALPCSKMPCSLSDYGCQDAFFTKYMQNRYGTWENAKAFWLSHRWW